MTERIIDACCLINLYATRIQSEIIEGCGEFYVTEQVQNEALLIRKVDEDDPTSFVKEEISLEAEIASGLIRPCDFENPDEWDSFVEFAAEVDDGEASCLAIAKVRGWVVSTDDQKAKRIAAENGVSVIGTPNIIQMWVDASGAESELVREALMRIETFAKFRPRRTDPLYDWWLQQIADT